MKSYKQSIIYTVSDGNSIIFTYWHFKAHNIINKDRTPIWFKD